MKSDTSGKALIAVGPFTGLLCPLMVLAPRVPFLGRLPGDIVVKRDRGSVYFSIVTLLVLSAFLALVASLVSWVWRR